MTTTAFIRRYVNKLEEGRMFETFDVLSYGTRANVDFALKELVKKKRIVRLARGIYMRGDDSTPLPSPEELAVFRAKSLGSVFNCLDEDELRHLRLINKEHSSKELIFHVDGAGCSFKYGEIRIVLKTVSHKKLRKLEQQRVLKRQQAYPRSNLNICMPLKMVTDENH